MFEFLKDTQNFAPSLVQCCTKSGKAGSGNGGQELTIKLANKIE